LNKGVLTAQKGYTQIIIFYRKGKFFLENEHELSDNIFDLTVSFGSLDSIMLLLSYNIPCKLDGLLSKACLNSLDVAVFVESLGGNFDEFGICELILSLEELKWINGHDVVYNGKFYKGCKIPTTTNNDIQLYLDYDCYDQVEFLLSLGASTDNLIFDNLFECDEKGKAFEIFKLLLRSGYRLKKETHTALLAEYPQHEINIWLYENYPKLFDDY
jgi:hypothetical protein